MSKQTVIQITTYDTKKTYEFVRGLQNENPPLWEVGSFVQRINQNGKISQHQSSYKYPKKIMYLEEETLKSIGLVTSQKKDQAKKDPEKTVEDAILELLEYVGVYPTE